ncbi:hypothetical protein HYS94_01490, partial [Candidatus Daviesbacteria bacterium]|nr:hypothetical protein [Candidatus Daviesbacteria bacterium]
RISAGDVDDPANYIIITREASSGFNRISAHAEFNNIAQTDVNFSTTDNAVAFKIERYGNVWNLFYSLTQYPNWVWTKLTQYEDANGDMTSVTSAYLYAESVGTTDTQIATGDFDNWKYYIGSGAIDQILSTLVLATGTFTTSSATVPADTGRLEGDNYWNGTLIIPTNGVAAFQPRTIVAFANAGGVFTIDPEAVFTVAPAVGDEYAIVAYQYPLEPGTDATSNSASAHVVGSKADTAQYDGTSTNSSLVRLLRAVHRGEILASGTLTLSDTTNPADAGRTEADNYWNGSWLMTTAGAVAFQPRLITDFQNATGTFNLDSQQPFTAAPGLVAYVILAPNSQLVPTADAATNTTPAHVIGNKSDAASVTAGSASIIARLRAIEAALSVNTSAGGEFELDGTPDLWDALVTDSSAQADITTLTGNRDAAVIQRIAALVNALQITDAGTATGFEEDGTGGRLWESITAVKGTFTTSSATVPADTGRTEANDYFNGDIIIPISGDVVRQARVIADFANAGGVFTLDSELPFTAVPGLVDYVIIHWKYPLVPAVDSAANTTSPHVVGNKSDTIPAMNLAPANDSIVRQLKAILERVGATPADPDDSILTNVGQRDDTATADSLADVTTTSIQAKLRRLLLRFSADAFSSTVQGVARTDVENMIQGLANYLSAAGAAWSVTANPGAAARDNLEQTLEDFADMLAGTTGIVTFPAAAVAANGISIAEVLRHVMEAVGEDTANNAFASTLVAENGDGSALERLEEIRGRTATGTFTQTAAMGTTVNTVTEISPIRHGQIAVELDINTLIAAAEGGTVIVRLLNMIDGATLRIIDRVDFTIGGANEVHPTVRGWVQEGTTTARITIQLNSAVTVNRDIPWRIIESA